MFYVNLFQLVTYLNVFMLFLKVLLPASNFLQLEFVRDACVKFLQKQLNPSNCLGIRAFADLHNCMELVSSSKAYTNQQFL